MYTNTERSVGGVGYVWISVFSLDALTKVRMHFYKPPQADILVTFLDPYLNFTSYPRQTREKRNCIIIIYPITKRTSINRKIPKSNDKSIKFQIIMKYELKLEKNANNNVRDLKDRGLSLLRNIQRKGKIPIFFLFLKHSHKIHTHITDRENFQVQRKEIFFLNKIESENKKITKSHNCQTICIPRM